MPTTTASSAERPDDVVDETLADIERSLLAIIRQAAMGRIHDRICRDTGIRLERARFAVLARVLEIGPARLSDIAQVARLDMSTTSRHVAHLERAGYVRRTPDPSDRRVVAVAATPEGVEVVQQLRRGWHAGLAEMLARWPEKERRSLAGYLGRLAEDIARYSDEAPASPSA